MSDELLPDGDLGFFCEEIARGFKERGIVLRNRITGRTTETARDIYNWSSRGELAHIWEWYAFLFPERVDFDRGGELHRSADWKTA